MLRGFQVRDRFDDAVIERKGAFDQIFTVAGGGRAGDGDPGIFGEELLEKAPATETGLPWFER